MFKMLPIQIGFSCPKYASPKIVRSWYRIKQRRIDVHTINGCSTTQRMPTADVAEMNRLLIVSVDDSPFLTVAHSSKSVIVIR